MRHDTPQVDDTPPQKLIALREVPALSWLPARRTGATLRVSTVIRWAQRGVGGRRLRTVRVGGTLATSEPWLLEFFEAGAPAEPQQYTATPARRQREIARARRELAAAGYGCSTE
ncbi:MAG: DUF1580 domain-containing protein [Phycisphaerales bacterium]|nr:DUF1580 domain-containing protein [Phycisphaerales bacterium]